MLTWFLLQVLHKLLGKCFTLDRLKRPQQYFCYLFILLKTPDLHLILELYFILFKICVKNHLKRNNGEFCIHAEKDHQCFYKNSTNQTFTFIKSKLVYFKKYRTNQVQHLEETKFLLPLNVLYCCQTVKIAVGALIGFAFCKSY